MTPGIHLNVPAEVYHALPGVSSSALKVIHTSTPLHCHHQQQTPFEETVAMRLGTLAHHAVLEPNTPFPTVVVPPEAYPCPADSSLVKTKKAAPGDMVPWHAAASYCKAWVKDQEAKGILVLTQSEFDRVLGMARALSLHPIVSALLERGQSEVTVLSHDDDLDIPIRSRIDWVPEGDTLITIEGGRTIRVGECIVDIKTTSDVSPRGFQKTLAGLAYHIQAAWNLDLFAAEGADRPYFVFIAVESQAPHDVAVYLADPQMIEIGRRDYLRAAHQWAACTRSGIWPGTPADLVPLISLPPWAMD